MKNSILENIKKSVIESGNPWFKWFGRKPQLPRKVFKGKGGVYFITSELIEDQWGSWPRLYTVWKFDEKKHKVTAVPARHYFDSHETAHHYLHQRAKYGKHSLTTAGKRDTYAQLPQ